MSNKKHCQYTDLVCLCCGNVASIQRGMSKLKSNGHIKDLWCYNCQDITKHYEVNDISKFMFDYGSKNGIEKKVYDLVISRREKSVRGKEKVLRKVSI